MPLVLILLLCLTVYLLYYFKIVIRKPLLIHADNAFNSQIIGACPKLHQVYQPPIWGFNCHVQIIYMLIRLKFRSKKSSLNLTTPIHTLDGGLISIDWFGLDSHRERDPILLVLPTICGNSEDLSHHLEYLQQRLNWVVAVCNRRGHGDLRLVTPKINIFGCMEDLNIQIDEVQKRFPDAPIYAYGLSAGTALLVRYLGVTGSKSRINAAIANSPGYNTELAFQRMRGPYNSIMTKKLKKYFLHRHYTVLAEKEGFHSCLQAKDMHDFHSRLHPLAGFASTKEFIAHTNPMLSAQDIAIPLLVLNAQDDPVCVVKNAYTYFRLIESLPCCILAITKYGSHCAFWEGWLGKNSWSDQVAVQFFQAIHQKKKGEPKTLPPG